MWEWSPNCVAISHMKIVKDSLKILRLRQEDRAPFVYDFHPKEK